ncbi:SLATT domain-containing protein [Bifidobacterium mongoliense]
MSYLETIEKRSYQTYRSRLNAYRRLKHRANAWDFTLVLYNTMLLFTSIYVLLFHKADTPLNNYLLVCMTTATLVVSLIVAGVNYRGRAFEMYRNYRALQRLSTEIEIAVRLNSNVSTEHVEDLNRRYQDLLDFTENHTENDFTSFARGSQTGCDTNSHVQKGSKRLFSLRLYSCVRNIASWIKIQIFDWAAPGIFWLISLVIPVLIFGDLL